jgi:hypothetical protein
MILVLRYGSLHGGKVTAQFYKAETFSKSDLTLLPLTDLRAVDVIATEAVSVSATIEQIIEDAVMPSGAPVKYFHTVPQ